MTRPKIMFREIIKIIPGLIYETVLTFRRSLTGIFEIEAESIDPAELEKLNAGKPIKHPLFGKSILIEVEILNKLKGKIIHIRPKNKKAS